MVAPRIWSSPRPRAGLKAKVNYSIIDEQVVISEGATVGEEKADGVEIAVVGRGTVIEKGEVVPAGANVEKEDK